jgi:multiple sugar transport system substrate-binding protein
MKIRRIATVAAAALAVGSLAACSGASGSGGGSTDAPKTITYWASQQSASIPADEALLQPELDKFEKQTGVKVKLEVIGWNDLMNRTLTAATSGVGPDVINIGDSNAATLQATGAFLPFEGDALKAVGGEDKFVPIAYATGGAEGQAPTSVPLLGYAYGLYYNKKLFAAKGLTPPSSWQDLVTDAKALTDPSAGKWGIAIQGGSVPENMHFAFIFGQQNGADPFNKDGSPNFTADGMVDGLQQYVDLIGKDKVANPTDAQSSSGNQSNTDFAKGTAAMLMGQNNVEAALAANGMKADDYGVVPIPAPKPLPQGGKDVGSFVAGINISVFKNTKNQDAALKFVNFMTSKEEQEIYDKPYGAISTIKDGVANFSENKDIMDTFTDIYANKSEPLPRIATFAAFTTNVGGALNALMAQAATTGDVSRDDIKAALDAAQQQMIAAG